MGPGPGLGPRYKIKEVSVTSSPNPGDMGPTGSLGVPKASWLEYVWLKAWAVKAHTVAVATARYGREKLKQKVSRSESENWSNFLVIDPHRDTDEDHEKNDFSTAKTFPNLGNHFSQRRKPFFPNVDNDFWHQTDFPTNGPISQRREDFSQSRRDFSQRDPARTRAR